MPRPVTMLFAVAALGGTAHAEPETVLTPRTLPSGAPACGNVMMKYGPPSCTVPVAAPAAVITAAAAVVEAVRAGFAFAVEHRGHAREDAAVAIAVVRGPGIATR